MFTPNQEQAAAELLRACRLWRSVYGPLQKAFGALNEAAQEQLAIDLLALIDRFNIATDGTMVAPADYLEVVVTKRAA